MKDSVNDISSKREMPSSIYGIVDHINEQLKMLYEKVDFIDNKNKMLSGRDSEKGIAKGSPDSPGLVGRSQDVLAALQALNTRFDFAFKELESYLG